MTSKMVTGVCLTERTEINGYSAWLLSCKDWTLPASHLISLLYKKMESCSMCHHGHESSCM